VKTKKDGKKVNVFEEEDAILGEAK